MSTLDKAREDRFGGRLWFTAILFGLVGQVAWVVENMYFATLAQDILKNSGRPELSYVITTLMVALSAVTATATSILAGGLSDRVGKRRPFVAYGYLAWGVTIMLFGLLPMRVEGAMVATVCTLLVLFDCLMTLCGSTANDAAFCAWVADVTTPKNRGRVNGVLSTLPVIAVVIVFLAIGPLYDPESERNLTFFLVLGLIPLVAGLLALPLFRDPPGLLPRRQESLLRDTLYGFSFAVIRRHPLLYITLAAACLVGIAQQTFFSYLINFVVITLGLGDGFVIPMAVIIVGAAALTGLTGLLSDRLGRRPFYFPLLALAIAGMLGLYLLQDLMGGAKTAVLYLGGVLMMGGVLALTGLLTAAFQDRIPEGCEGRFQGVRMCFTVLIPMIVGPLVSLLIGLDAMGMNGEGFVPPYTIFLAGALIATTAALPLWLVRKNEA